jgi:hypothetical protein
MPLLAIIALAAFAAVQAPATKYDGTWIAQFDGVTWARLELRSVSGAVTGGITLGNIELNKDGTLRHAEPAPKELSPIFDVRQQGAAISFSRKDANDTDRFEVSPAGTDILLTFLFTEEDRREFAAEGFPLPKPVRLARGK